MINLRNSPFLWLALLLLLAYSVVEHYDFIPTGTGLWILFSVFILCALATSVIYKPGKQIVATLFLSICILLAGVFRHAEIEKENFPKDDIAQGGKSEAIVSVISVLKKKTNSLTLHCKVLESHIENANQQIPFTDKFILVRIKGSQYKRFYPQDILNIQGWLFPISAPKNPHAFDLRQYYKTLGIRHQISCADSTIFLHPNQGYSFMRLSAKWQAQLCDIITQHTSTDVAQMSNALVFGERSSMDEEIRDAFANSGAMHVLSVSGMHMAIIYSMLYLMLGAPGSGALPRRMIRLCFYALSILIYVGLTGASPAVWRAGLMIILFIVGKAMGWNTQIWNLLGFAAFVMLWSNPFIWHNIGFQLSFLAMAGILLFAKPIIRYYSFRQIILQRIWEITSVSIAAQIFIIPIILHQFYQLPLTFALSSLVAMPASYIIIFGALLNIILSPLHLDWLWQWYDQLSHFFLFLMKWMAGLNPDMNFSMPFYAQLWLMMSALSFACGLLYQWSNGRKLALLFSLTGLLTLCWHRTRQWTTSDLTVYHNYSGLVMDIIMDGRCISLQDSMVSDQHVEFSAGGNRVFRDVIHVDPLDSNKIYTRADRYLSHAGFYSSALSLWIWNGKEIPPMANPRASYLLIDHCPDIIDLKNYLQTNNHSVIILPVHLERKTKKEIIECLQVSEIKFWDIDADGYFSIPL